MDLHAIVHKFRAAIDHLSASGDLPYFLNRFPAGCCGITSELLGEYLNSLDIGTYDYICGEHDGASQSWLECEGVIVDITSDQFDGRPPIYIGAPDDWYDKWEESSRPGFLGMHSECSAFFPYFPFTLSSTDISTSECAR